MDPLVAAQMSASLVAAHQQQASQAVNASQALLNLQGNTFLTRINQDLSNTGEDLSTTAMGLNTSSHVPIPQQYAAPK